MHSGMRGGPHVGAFRHHSFTETEIKLQANSTSVSSTATCGLAYQQVLRVPVFQSYLQLLLLSECAGRPDDKQHTLTEREESWYFISVYSGEYTEMKYQTASPAGGRI